MPDSPLEKAAEAARTFHAGSEYPWDEGMARAVVTTYLKAAAEDEELLNRATLKAGEPYYYPEPAALLTALAEEVSNGS